MKKPTAQTPLLVPSLSACLLAMCTSGPTFGQGAADLEAVLDSARRAAGWAQLDPGQQLRLTGKVTYLGVEETFIEDFARDGRFRTVFEEELTREVRFDGQGVHLAEYSALWHELEFFGREAALLRAWVHGGYWLDPSVPLSIGNAQTPAPDGLIGLDLRIDGGRLGARVELDAEDHLVRTLSLDTGNGVLRTEYAGHAAVEGLWIAHEVRGQMSMGTEYTLTVLEAGFEPLDAGVFTPAPVEPDFVFDFDAVPDVEVVRSKSKHLWVRARVNGEDLGLFLFDTGAGFSGISVEAADKLGLSAFGSSSMTGLGGEVTTTRMRRAETLQIGPLTIENLVFSEIPVARKERMVGEKVAGVLGWDVMRRAVVDLEPRGKLRLYEPTTYELADGQWHPMNLHYKVPYISGRFAEDREGLFMLDCGAAGMTVMFFHHAAKALGFLEENTTPTSTGHGAGGSFERRLDHLDWFELAGEHVDDLTIIVSTAADGEADPYSLGLIGGGLLRLYRLVFDYPNKRVAILPL